VACAFSNRANNASGVLREKRGSPLAGEKAFSPIGGAWLGSGESIAAWAAPHALVTAAAIVPGGDSGATRCAAFVAGIHRRGLLAA